MADMNEIQQVLIPAKELADTELGDISNSQEVLKQILASIVPPNSSAEYISSISTEVKKNFNVDAMPIINRLLKKKDETLAA